MPALSHAAPPSYDLMSAARPIETPFAAWLPVYQAGGEMFLKDDCRPRSELPEWIKDAWLSWTAPEDQRIIAAQTWRGGSSGIGVYELTADGPVRTGCSHSSGESVHEVLDFSHVAFDARAGRTYLFQLWQRGGGLQENSGIAVFEADNIDLSAGGVSVAAGISLSNRVLVVSVGVHGPRTVPVPPPPLVEGEAIWYGSSTLLKLAEIAEITIAPAGRPELEIPLSSYEFAWRYGSEPRSGALNGLSWPAAGCTGAYDVTVTLTSAFSTDPVPENNTATTRIVLDDGPTVPGCFPASLALGARAPS